MRGRPLRCRATAKMRIVAGAWRGRTLVAPPGQGTRPTADRVRQALFDMLMHAEWGGRSMIESAVVLDVFAGTGALGLEALSRGAASAYFIEADETALRALRANVAMCKAGERAVIVARDVFSVLGHHRHVLACPDHPSQDPAAMGSPDKPGHSERWGGKATEPASLVFLDPPYGQDLVPRVFARLRDSGRIRSNALIVAETACGETWTPDQPLLAERQHGAARILVFRAT